MTVFKVEKLAWHHNVGDFDCGYEYFGFIASQTDSLHLFVLIKDIRQILGS
jgi:hypothetical protein